MDSNGFRNLSGDELQMVMQICAELHHADPSISYVNHCQGVLRSALRTIHFSAEIYQLESFSLPEQPTKTVDEKYLPIFAKHILDHPYVAGVLSGNRSEIGLTQAERMLELFKPSVLYNEFYNQAQFQNQLWIGIESKNQLLTCIYSRDTEYSEAELGIIQLIQPHLETAWKNWNHARTLQNQLTLLKETLFQSEEEESRTARIRKVFDTLTPRQRDVAELVADGMDNQQIAEQLRISKETVKKHLQAIFHVLNISHRTELASRWHQAHSVSLY